MSSVVPLPSGMDRTAGRPVGAAAGGDAGLRELLAVREIAQAFLTAERAEDVYRFALERVTQLVGASFACVYLVDEGTDLMRLTASHNWPERYARFLGEMRVRLGVGASGEAASERRVIEVSDVFADPTLDDWRDVASELGFRALVALPLQTASGVLGTVTFYFASASALTPESRGLLRVVADQMSATAEKARLITTLQQTNAELERQFAALMEARRLQDEFLSNVSHELRTPLTAVLGYLALMEEGLAGPVNAEQQHTLAQVKASSERLLCMIGDLLDLASLKRGEMRPHVDDVNPRDPINDALAALIEKKDTVTVRLEETAVLPMIRTDRRKLARLLTALLQNAVKFTDAGEVRVSVALYGDRVCYRVRDTGKGIGSDAQHFVFDEFRQEDGSPTRRHGGSGLGLSIARRLARLLGGDVTMSSEPGKGSTFTVDLPRELTPDAGA